MSRSTRLTDAEQHTLLAVWRLGGETTGDLIRDELATRIERRVSVSAIYVILVRLERRGLVASRRSDPEPVRGGKARRYFSIQRAGIRELEQSRRELELMWDGLRPTPGLSSR